MIESASEGTLDARKLVLGFDAACLACGELARRIERRTGGTLEVRSLHDPQLEHWRKRALGADAPWAPTLFEVRGVRDVRAWTGPKMAVRLARALGPISTLRVIQALGEVGTLGAPPDGTSVAMSRGQFLKFTGGAALAFGIFFGLPNQAQATHGGPDEEALAAAFSLIEEIPDPVAARGEEAARQWLLRRANADVRNGDLQTRGVFGCARAIIVAIATNAIPVLKIRKAIAAFGGARNLARFIVRNFKRFRRLGNAWHVAARKTAKAVAKRVLNLTGEQVLGAMLALFNVGPIRKECF